MIYIHSRIVAELVKKFVDYGIGAEIGVYKGNTSEYLLDNTNTTHLYCIDPWPAETNKIYKKQWGNEEDFKNVIKMSKNYAPRITVMRKYSEDAIYDIKDELDFVFIDGNHEYNYWAIKKQMTG